MKRLRAGLVGAGLVGQAEHAFYLWEDRERFDFVGLADASAAVRNALGVRYGIQQLHADLPSLLKAAKLDALVIAAPDPFHPDLAVTALEAGLHVLCEKPLSLTLSGCDRIKAARDKAGTVLQVAYMKRHDPAFKKALDLLPNKIEDVKLISVEVNDPDQNPFVAHLPMTVADDLPATLRDQFRTEISWRRYIGARYSGRVTIGDEQVSNALKRIAADASKPQYLLGEVFPQLLGGAEPPRDPLVWELSRFAAVDFTAPQGGAMGQFSSPVAVGLLERAIEVAREQGAERLITVSPLGIERLLRREGFRAHRAAPPMIVDGHPIFACWIEVADRCPPAARARPTTH